MCGTATQGRTSESACYRRGNGCCAAALYAFQPMKRSRLPRCRGAELQAETGNRPSLRPQNILEMLPHRLLITEVVIVLHQAIEQRFVYRAPRGLDLNRAQRPQRHRQRRGVDQDRLWPGTPRAALAADVAAYRRQPRFGRPAPTSEVALGKPCRARRRWPVSIPGPRITAATASIGYWWDASE